MKWELLLLDDEPCILDALAELLTEDDINVTRARNGLEGLALLKERHFDVVVSDIFMPLMDGVKMLSEARASGIFVPHIFFSANPDPAIIEEINLAGGAPVIKKPYFAQLSAEINSVLTKHEFMNLRNAYSGEINLSAF